MVTETARAKVNLCLHVTGQRDDGFHLLDSLVAFADIGDRLHVAPAETLSLTIEGPFAADLSGADDNLVLRAARMVGARAAITLEKTLPVASGIGGGSADAAACLRALTRLGHQMPPLDDLVSLGADVPVCVSGGLTRMRGIGEVLEPAPAWPDLHAVLVNPGVGVSTPAIFAALQTKANAPLGWPVGPDPIAWLAAQRNDLEPPARAAVPAIGTALDALTAQGGVLARMCGSGATCYGVFRTAAAARSAAVALSRPGWWAVATTLSGSGAPSK